MLFKDLYWFNEPYNSLKNRPSTAPRGLKIRIAHAASKIQKRTIGAPSTNRPDPTG